MFYCDTATFGLAPLNIRQARRTLFFVAGGMMLAWGDQIGIDICKMSTMPHLHLSNTHPLNPQTKNRPWISSRRGGCSSARTRPWTWPARAASTPRACRAWRSAVRQCVRGGFVVAGVLMWGQSRVWGYGANLNHR